MTKKNFSKSGGKNNNTLKREIKKQIKISKTEGKNIKTGKKRTKKKRLYTQ
jgi:hypothetical protein